MKPFLDGLIASEKSAKIRSLNAAEIRGNRLFEWIGSIQSYDELGVLFHVKKSRECHKYAVAVPWAGIMSIEVLDDKEPIEDQA